MKGEYSVIVKQSSSNHEYLKNAKEGTAMLRVYKETMEGDPDAFVMGSPEARERMLADDKTLFFSSWMTFQVESIAITVIPVQ